MTFSLVAFDGKNYGVAVASGSVDVIERVPWVEKGVGAIATQGYTETRYGWEGLKLLKKGITPEGVLKEVSSKDQEPERRQVAIVDSLGRKVSHTGSFCPDKKSSKMGRSCVAIGNLLEDESSVEAMVEKFAEDGDFPFRILNALKAGVSYGGDRRGNRTAALVVRGDENLEIGIGLSDSPIEDLEKKYQREIS